MPSRPILREHWSKKGFILAAIGSAVGLGNIWRFPYMVGTSGGGAFLIPYILGVLLFGLPLMLLELYSGKNYRSSLIPVLKKINPRFYMLGAIPVAITFGILSYYLVVTGWTLAYFIFSITGYMEFSEFSSSTMPLLFFLVSLFITGAVVSSGIKHGIEKTCTILMPIFFVLLVGLALYSLTLPGALKGLEFYLSPNFAYLYRVEIWMKAFAQAFFSLSVGYGILLTYASYMEKKGKIFLSAGSIATADTLIAFIGGLIVFPIVFSFGLNPAAGPELSFVSLPTIFQKTLAGHVVGMIFFLLLFIAAITSSVSMLELGAATLIDTQKWSRKKSVILLSLVILLAGTPSALSYYGKGITLWGVPFLDFMDMLFGRLLLVSAVVLCVYLTWLSKTRIVFLKGKEGINNLLNFLLRYIIPPVLLLMLIFG